MRRSLPLGGVLLSAMLLSFAATRYPGGYEWLNHSFSRLFQPEALNGEINAARWYASLAVLVFSASMAVVFQVLSKCGPTKFHRDTVQIGGVGSMVYTGLVVTPMHDLLVGFALAFFVVAMFAIFHWLYLERRFRTLGTGVICISMTLGNAAMYYGQVLYGFLPIVQKLALVLWVTWLFGLYFYTLRSKSPELADRSPHHSSRV